MTYASDIAAASTPSDQSDERVHTAADGKLVVDHIRNDPELVQAVVRFMQEENQSLSVIGCIKDGDGIERTNYEIGTRILCPDFMARFNCFLFCFSTDMGVSENARVFIRFATAMILATRDNMEAPETIQFRKLTVTQPKKRKRSELEGYDGDVGEDDETIKEIIINFKSLSVMIVRGFVSDPGRIDSSGVS